MLAVTKHHIHAVGIGESPAVTAFSLPPVLNRHTPLFQGAIDGSPIDGGVWANMPILTRPADELWNGSSVIFSLFFDKEIDEFRR
jgi:hypothetical protein